MEPRRRDWSPTIRAHECCFAGSVGADQSEEVAAVQIQGDILDGHELAEGYVRGID